MIPTYYQVQNTINVSVIIPEKSMKLQVGIHLIVLDTVQSTWPSGAVLYFLSWDKALEPKYLITIWS